MTKRIIILSSCLFFLLALGAAQESGSGRIQHIARELGAVALMPDAPSGGKCGTHLVASLNEHVRSADLATQESVRRTLSRPILQTSRVSPSGRFRIHYDTTGFNEPALLQGNTRMPNSYSIYVDSVAAIFDYVWRVQVEQLGYNAPPSDKGKGGGLEYDIYVVNLGGGTFGVTYWSEDDAISTGTNQRFSTYMEIDNDYVFYRTSGLDGLRVTAAHEFHHAIQIGSYGLWTNVPQGDLYFYEMSSTWMEDILYPQVNDYVFDVPKFFRQYFGTSNRSLPFFTYDPWQYPGYERAVFLHYLAQRHGRDLVRGIWEAMAEVPFKESVHRVLTRAGSRFEAEFAQFSYWNFYTADRALPDRYYPEGHLYPRMIQNMRATHNDFSTAITSAAYPVSSQVYEFVTREDTLTAILVNVDLAEARINSNILHSFDLRIVNSASQGAIQKLANGASGALSVADLERWRVMYLSANSRTDIKTEAIPYPNPLRPEAHPFLRLPVNEASAVPVDVGFYSSSLDRVFAGSFPVSDSFGQPEIIIPTGHITGKLPSGVYIVAVRVDQKEYRWKVAIIQ
ncbi:MAG: hypothetical protein FJ215_13080 [Ignavibacteria bacterium]|nr:hypothetical protein [Ignavibacteria bacterium]